MVQVIRNDKLYLSYAKNFLQFEWTLEESDLCLNKTWQSSKFNMGGGEPSYLELRQGEQSTPCLLLLNYKCVENGLFMTILCDNNNKTFYSVIKKLTPCSRCYNVDLLPVFWNKPCPTQYPIKIFVTIRANAENLFEVNHTRCNEGFDFKSVLGLDVNTDIVLRVDKENIKAHKVVLEARSPVFRKMFANDSDESFLNKVYHFASGFVKKMKSFHFIAMHCVFGAACPSLDFASLNTVDQNKVEISDIKPTTMKRFLTFLYTEKVEICTPNDLLELYIAVDKYDVWSLRGRIDLLKFADIIDVENACILFTVANRHNHEDLKKGVVKFVSANLMSVINGAPFSKMNKEEMILLMRLCTSAMEK